MYSEIFSKTMKILKHVTVNKIKGLADVIFEKYKFGFRVTEQLCGWSDQYI